MEDYQSAFLHRFKDTKALHSANRKIAAMHFGGITVECLLKAIVLSSLPTGTVKEWKTDLNDPGHTIGNPKHNLVQAIKCNNRLYSRAQKFKHVVEWLNAVENPSQHFIDIRYSCNEPEDLSYKQWFSAYTNLISWLQRQATQL
ncbi:hypothetical protein [Phormidium sp. FACHB-1136]|uniref:hypothetical protein n=1 Tax=Phormidium sp. FACHB-1136 TaxID=2692848 RepID=UPI001684020C|nr:hypothetical protein [Phormidium sp. FACHB-1136]MBD2428868.1 hypothetical protein [Phormidium sp. FACHB-1136]